MKKLIPFIILSCFVLIKMNSQEKKMLLPDAGAQEKVYTYTNHALSYNTSYRLSSWVSYWVSVNLTGEISKIKMEEDPNITFRAAEKKDYKKSTYQPMQYMSSLDVAKNEEALEESFYLSNFMPVKPAFYKFIWIRLEKLIRYWAKDADLQVITGPVLTESPYATIGDNKVIVPKTIYKIIYSPTEKKAIGFIIKSSVANGKLKSFVVPIDKIEEITGFDFLSDLPDELENSIESVKGDDKWGWKIPE